MDDFSRRGWVIFDEVDKIYQNRDKVTRTFLGDKDWLRVGVNMDSILS